MYNPPAGTPDPMMNLRARLRPMGVGDILDETFRLYRENFTLFVATCAVIEVPLQIILTALSFGMLSALQPIANLQGIPAQNYTPAQVNALVGGASAAGGLGLLIALLALVASALVGAALAVAISNRYLGRPVTVGMAYSAAGNRLGSVLVALIWAFIRLIPLILLSVILIGIPFLVYFFVAWSLIPQAIMLEGTSGIGASRRSRELISGYWWKSFGLIVVVAVLLAILSRIPLLIIDSIVSSTVGGLGARTVLEGIVNFIVGVLTMPIQATALTLLFYDLKIRKEAFDLEAMVQRANLATPTTPY